MIILSHPTWVRGLKRFLVQTLILDNLSHPTWVRGLKLWLSVCLLLVSAVAPYVGAWIETPKR